MDFNVEARVFQSFISQSLVFNLTVLISHERNNLRKQFNDFSCCDYVACLHFAFNGTHKKSYVRLYILINAPLLIL